MYKKTAPRHFLGALCALLLVTSATAAFAQEEPTAVEQNIGIIVSSATSSSTTVGIMMAALKPFSSTTSSPSKVIFGKLDSLEQYASANAHAIHQDIATGGGASIRDLADLCGLKPHEVPTFARALRQHRATFSPILRTAQFDRAATVALATALQSTIDQAVRPTPRS